MQTLNPSSTPLMCPLICVSSYMELNFQRPSSTKYSKIILFKFYFKALKEFKEQSHDSTSLYSTVVKRVSLSLSLSLYLYLFLSPTPALLLIMDTEKAIFSFFNGDSKI